MGRKSHTKSLKQASMATARAVLAVKAVEFDSSSIPQASDNDSVESHELSDHNGSSQNPDSDEEIGTYDESYLGETRMESWLLENENHDLEMRRLQKGGSYLRAVYTGNSRTSDWRKRKAAEALKEHAKGYRRIDQFFAPQQSLQDFLDVSEEHQEDLDNDEKLAIANAEQTLREQFQRIKNKGSVIAGLSIYQTNRLFAVHLYFQLLLDGKKKVDASRHAAKYRWPTQTTHACNMIRKWAKTYLLFGDLPLHSQGKHSKRCSILSDEDIKNTCVDWLRNTNSLNRSPAALRQELITTILPKFLGVETPPTISINTVRKFMRNWGFSHRTAGQQVYYDGHEREDVIGYRKAWAKRMMEYRKRMEEYSGDDMEIAVPPTRLEIWDKKHVLVTHDECAFYSNDVAGMSWLEDGETVLRKKGQGGSIMVSDFLCACHGPLRLPENEAQHLELSQSARELLKIGKGQEGYWKSEHMVAQLTTKALPIFEALHPGCVGVFCFDQSTNHNAYPSDALLASRITLKPKIEENWTFKNGWYIVNGRKISKSMFASGQNFKGIRTILQERGLWNAGMRLDCKENVSPGCCARHVLANQPDFLEQKTSIFMEVNKAGHIFELYPKFHCECNFIERFWGASKRIARHQCDYSFRSLCNRIPGILDSIPLPMIKRFARRAWRYTEAYSVDLDIVEADKVVQKFKPHRRLREEE